MLTLNALMYSVIAFPIGVVVALVTSFILTFQLGNLLGIDISPWLSSDSVGTAFIFGSFFGSVFFFLTKKKKNDSNYCRSCDANNCFHPTD